MGDDYIEIPWNPDDLNDGVHEVDLVPDVHVRTLIPRTGVSDEVRERGVAMGFAVKLAALQVEPGRIHVLDPTDFDPPATDLPHSKRMIREQRYLRDASMVVVGDIGPSTGMGIECHMRALGTIPCMLIAPETADINPLLEAVVEPTVSTIRYSSLEGLLPKLRCEIARILPAIRESDRRRRQAAKNISKSGFPMWLFTHRMLCNSTLQELAAATNIPEFQLREMERDPVAVAHASYLQLHQVADALHVTLRLNPDSGPQLHGNGNAATFIKNSCHNLYAALKADRLWLDCEDVLRTWRAYLASIGLKFEPQMASSMGHRLVGTPSCESVWDKSEWDRRLYNTGDGTLYPGY